MSNLRNIAVESHPGYLIFFDNVRVDQFVLDFSCNLGIDGSIGSASINMIYVPDLDKITHAENLGEISSVQDSTELSQATSQSTIELGDYRIDSWPSLMYEGMINENVQLMQQCLIDLGYSEITWTDGIFGARTKQGVIRFQQDSGIGVDGIVGAQTRQAIQDRIASLSAQTLQEASVTDGMNLISDDGVENMTNVRIFMKNVFTGKYTLVFGGNIRSKSISISAGQRTLTFQAQDYMNWLNRTICPIAVPYDGTLTVGDRLKWKAQGIDITKVSTVNTVKDITFKGKNISQTWETISNQTIAANKLYSADDTVSSWDNALSRVVVMGDIDERLRKAEIMDFMITSSATSANSIYVMMNDILRMLMFEFYQDRDETIRIKPPFWNEHVLKNHVIDSTLIKSYTETTNYSSYYTRVLASGGLEEWQDSASDGDIVKSILTPVVTVTSGGLTTNSGPVVVTSQVSGMTNNNSGSPLGQKVVSVARQYIGWSYQWGGDKPSDGGFDCSGLIYWAYKQVGISIPRVTYDQVKGGAEVSKNDLQPGDLIFPKEDMSHVILYAGNGKCIEAPRTGLNIREISSWDFVKARRYVYDSGQSTTKKSSDISSVGPDTLLEPTYMEKKYGPLVYDTTQPLIKFSTSQATGSQDAYEALTKYARFMLNYLNSNVSLASLTAVAMPWIRPGFNVWVDPSVIDKVFYVNSISHFGNASGIYTTLNLSLGRSRKSFVSNSSSLGGLKPGESDDIFINTLSVTPENFGPVCDYDSVKSMADQFHSSQDGDNFSYTSTKNEYFSRLYGDTDFKYFEPQALQSQSNGNISVNDYEIDSWPDLLYDGMVGESVRLLQQCLIDMGYTGVTWTDEIFGARTKQGVIDFQSNQGIGVDGIVGPETRNAIKNALSSNDESYSSSSYAAYSDRAEFQSDHNIDEICDTLNNKYSNAPSVVSQRASRLKNIVNNSTKLMSKMYAGNN